MARHYSSRGPRRPDNFEDFVQRYVRGETLVSLAKELGVCLSTIKKWFAKRGVVLRSKAEVNLLSNKARAAPRTRPRKSKCWKCGEIKPASAFSRCHKRACGLDSWCRECQSARVKAHWEQVKSDPETANREREKNWEVQIRIKFGMTAADYWAMHEAQNGVCAICHHTQNGMTRRGTPRRLAVDHDHMTGKVRGLLCDRCNRGMGAFHDNPEELRKATAYLENHAKESVCHRAELPPQCSSQSLFDFG